MSGQLADKLQVQEGGHLCTVCLSNKPKEGEKHTKSNRVHVNHISGKRDPTICVDMKCQGASTSKAIILDTGTAKRFCAVGALAFSFQPLEVGVNIVALLLALVALFIEVGARVLG